MTVTSQQLLDEMRKFMLSSGRIVISLIVCCYKASSGLETFVPGNHGGAT